MRRGGDRPDHPREGLDRHDQRVRIDELFLRDEVRDRGVRRRQEEPGRDAGDRGERDETADPSTKGSAANTPKRTRSDAIMSRRRDRRSTSGPSRKPDDDDRQEVRDQESSDPDAGLRQVVDLQRRARRPRDTCRSSTPQWRGRGTRTTASGGEGRDGWSSSRPASDATTCSRFRLRPFRPCPDGTLRRGSARQGGACRGLRRAAHRHLHASCDNLGEPDLCFASGRRDDADEHELGQGTPLSQAHHVDVGSWGLSGRAGDRNTEGLGGNASVGSTIRRIATRTVSPCCANSSRNASRRAVQARSARTASPRRARLGSDAIDGTRRTDDLVVAGPVGRLCRFR